MSIQAVAWALNQNVRVPALKLILVVLANHADERSGECFLKVRTIAREASMSSRTIHRHLPKLEELGLVRIQNHNVNGGRVASSYWLACGRGYANLSQPSRRFASVRSPDSRGRDTAVATMNRNLNQNYPLAPKPRLAPQTSNRPARSRRAEYGKFEMEITERLGSDGLEMLANLSERSRERLCELQANNRLSDDALWAAFDHTPFRTQP